MGRSYYERMFNWYNKCFNNKVSIIFFISNLIIAFAFCSCVKNQSSENKETTTIVKIDSNNTTDKQNDLKALLVRDSKLAVEILNSALKSNNIKIAGYAAVYVSRLKIISDKAVIDSALIACSKSDDILLSTLCWRHLATDSKPDIPKLEKSKDTVTQIFIALSLIKRNQNYSKFKTLFYVEQDGKISNSDTASQLTVSPLLKAYDNAPIALALAFIKAKNSRQFIKKDNIKINKALKIRHQLFRSVGVEEPEFKYKNSNIKTSTIPQKLESSFVNQSTDSLRNICINGNPSLQREAVLALAVKKELPQSLDFAAAAAVMQSEDEKIKIEGARTYLLLLERSKNQTANND